MRKKTTAKRNQIEVRKSFYGGCKKIGAFWSILVYQNCSFLIFNFNYFVSGEGAGIKGVEEVVDMGESRYENFLLKLLFPSYHFMLQLCPDYHLKYKGVT